MENQAEDLFIVVGAQSDPGACYRNALAARPGSLCIGLDRAHRSHEAHWDARDKNLLRLDWCNTYDESFHAVLRSFIERGHFSLPPRVTVLFAAGRNTGQDGAPWGAADRRRQPEIPCFNALALKNIVTAIEEAVEARAAKDQAQVSLRVVALSSQSAPKATIEAFVGKCVSGHNQRTHPHVIKSGLVLKVPADGIAADALVAMTLPRILSLREGETSVMNIETLDRSPARAWQKRPEDAAWKDKPEPRWGDKAKWRDGLWLSRARTREPQQI